MKNEEKLKKRDNHDSYTFLKGKRAWYCVYDDGIVTRTWLGNMREERVATFYRKKYLYCKAGNKDYKVKQLVAEHFIEGYKKGLAVIQKDGNPYNCDVNNLLLLTPKENGKRTGGMAKVKHQVTITKESGEVQVFPSVRQAAKSLFVSYQTLLDFVAKKYKTNVLDGLQVEIEAGKQ